MRNVAATRKQTGCLNRPLDKYFHNNSKEVNDYLVFNFFSSWDTLSYGKECSFLWPSPLDPMRHATTAVVYRQRKGGKGGRGERNVCSKHNKSTLWEDPQSWRGMYTTGKKRLRSLTLSYVRFSRIMLTWSYGFSGIWSCVVFKKGCGDGGKGSGITCVFPFALFRKKSVKSDFP